MSDKLPQQPQNEEVDLGQLFNAIGKLFEKLFAFIGKILKSTFSIIIYALKPFVNNFKLIAIVLMAATLIGFIVDKVNKPIYHSDMLVRPYFDSKYQLANNVDYFNALISSDNVSELSRIFEIDTIDAKELISFEIEIGPETQNDLLIEYDNYISSIDSLLADDVTFDDYVLNRDILAGTIFSIKAKSHKMDIFKSLEKGFVNTFENEYSKKLKRVRDSSLLIKKESHRRELQTIDSLQKTYLEIMKYESKNANQSITGPSGLFPLMQERTKTREYDLFKEESTIREKLRVLDVTLIEESDFYAILSRFEDVGAQENILFEKLSVILPLLALTLLISVFILFNIFKFIKNYE